jgi:hypothetical protein
MSLVSPPSSNGWTIPLSQKSFLDCTFTGKKKKGARQQNERNKKCKPSRRIVFRFTGKINKAEKT